MKKSVLSLFIMLLFLNLFANEKIQKNKNNIESKKGSLEKEINIPYKFKIKVKSKEWKKLTKERKIYNAFQIPKDTLLKMTTNALLETLINVPFMDDCLGYDQKEKCFNSICKKLNVYNELITRDNYKDTLLKKYYKLCNAKKPSLDSLNDIGVHCSYDFFVKIFSIEMLLNQDIILKQLLSDEKNRLFMNLNKRFNTPITGQTGYSVNKTGAYILADHLLKNNKEYVKEYNNFISQHPKRLWNKSETKKIVIRNILRKLVNGSK